MLLTEFKRRITGFKIWIGEKVVHKLPAIAHNVLQTFS
jgi:hypothetical protein